MDRATGSRAPGLVAGAVVVGVVARAVPWKCHVELRATKEALPAHGPVASVWWSNSGWALAVGPAGEVLLRDDAHTEEAAAATWHALSTSTKADLRAVAGGSFWGDRGQGEEHAIVAGDGAILDCTDTRCIALALTGHHRAVACGGGEALVVGDEGSVVRVFPWFTDYTVPLPERAGRTLRVSTLPELGITGDLRAVDVACTGDDSEPTCQATLSGVAGVLARGVRTGRCDDGTRLSGSQTHRCTWTWSRAPAPGDPPASRELTAWTPVDVVSTKLWWTRTERRRALVTFGDMPNASVDGATLPVASPHHFVGAATQYLGLGESTLWLDDSGDVYVAR
jgi:hypothetical protein